MDLISSCCANNKVKHNTQNKVRCLRLGLVYEDTVLKGNQSGLTFHLTYVVHLNKQGTTFQILTYIKNAFFPPSFGI